MRRGRVLSVLVAVIVAVIAGSTAYVWHLGYLGGPVYTVVEARGADRDGTVAVFFSGDMGFNAGMGPTIAGHIADAGIPVLAVNSLTAFAHRRSVVASNTLVADAVARAEAMPGAKRVMLIGQSFGANIVLAGAAALPPALKRNVAIVELIVPSDSMLFRATPGGAFDITHDGPALPYAQQLTGPNVLCLHGESETGSLCPEWHQRNVTSVALPGGHFLHEDSALVTATLLRALGGPDA
ncbi:AcvB/VirJ family lysyl-phosphatidylglycerol hydrolase [Sphingomonas floccifaciens]|uniref:AcvB/VirJ family lysyl-phosphatidylglycerol hydrolase n=1 Tax=Sphingomonas floccifaciens TaxID=1844115 RepID=A0ABW4N7K4_9SPHN